MSQEILQTDVTDFIGVDIYEEYYYTKGNAFYKSNNNNNYENIRYGHPDVIDISNPLQILILYKFFNKVITLDNQLNFITEYNVPIGTELIANAGENKIWAYNNILQTINIYDLKNAKTEVSSTPITNTITQLKGDLNNAIVKTAHNEIDTYNYVARKTSSSSLDKSLLPISMRNTHRILDNVLFKEQIEIDKIPESIIAFEIQNDILYYLSNSIIFKKDIRD